MRPESRIPQITGPQIEASGMRSLSTLEKSGDIEWLTATEGAKYLKIRPRTLLLWTRQGRVKGYAVGGTRRRVWRFRRNDLDAALLGTEVVESGPASSVFGGEERL